MKANSWSSIRKGDKDAFIDLYESIYQDLYRYGYKLSGNKDLTKDCIQQMFFEIWDKRTHLPEVFNVKSYLLKYLQRKIFREQTKEGISLENTILDRIEKEQSYEELIINNQQSETLKLKLQRAFSNLTKGQRQVIELKFYEGLSTAEIAQFTKSTHRTVYNQLHTAIKILRKNMTALNPILALFLSLFW